MDIRQLSYFVEVAEQQSFTKAAHRLNISQPALSKCISNLEDEFGLKLFVRHAGSISITEEGQLALGIARELLGSFSDAQEQLSDLGGKKRSAVSLGCSPILHTIFGGNLFPDSVGTHSRISCLEATASQLISETANHRLDMALCLLCRSEVHEALGRTSFEPFRTGALVTAISAAAPPFDPNYENMPDDRKIVTSIDFLPFMQENAKYYSTAVYTENLNAIRDYVLNQDYIALIPDIAAPFMGENIRISPLQHPEHYTLAFISPQGAKPGKTTREIRRYLESKLSALL